MKTTKVETTIQQSGTYSGLMRRLRELSKDRLVWSMLGVSLLVRFLYWWMISDQSPMETLIAVPPDSRIYVQLARDFCHFTITDENNIYMTGFGYSSFLAVLLYVSGMSFHFALFCQIVLSAFSSVLLYVIGVMVTGKRGVGFVAGMIHALSFTAITLSVSFLSESLFFFLICLAVIVFIRMMRNPGGLDYVALGLLLAFAVFTRSVAQFLPPVFLIVGILVTRLIPAGRRLETLKRVAGGVALSLLLIFTWALRNNIVHGTLVVAGTGPGAAAMYLGARVASERSDSLSVYDYRNEFRKEMRELNDGPLNYAEANQWYTSKLKDLFRYDPSSFVNTYLGIVEENIFDVDHIAELRMPAYKWRVRSFTLRPTRYNLDIVAFILAGIGVLILFAKRMPLLALLLPSLYLYFAGISGFTFWQGSRILYPGLLPMAILMGVAVYYPVA
jgi:hypothetical protein